MSRKRVTLTVEIVFDGDYYLTDELVDLSRHWIEGTFTDRDDSPHVTVTGTAELLDAPEPTS